MLQVLIFFMLQSPIARNVWHCPLATSFSLERSCPSYTCAQRQWPKAFPELPEKVMAKVLSKYLKGIDSLDLLPMHKTITLITMKKTLKASVCIYRKFIFMWPFTMQRSPRYDGACCCCCCCCCCSCRRLQHLFGETNATKLLFTVRSGTLDAIHHIETYIFQHVSNIFL